MLSSGRVVGTWRGRATLLMLVAARHAGESPASSLPGPYTTVSCEVFWCQFRLFRSAFLGYWKSLFRAKSGFKICNVIDKTGFAQKMSLGPNFCSSWAQNRLVLGISLLTLWCRRE